MRQTHRGPLSAVALAVGAFSLGCADGATSPPSIPAAVPPAQPAYVGAVKTDKEAVLELLRFAEARAAVDSGALLRKVRQTYGWILQPPQPESSSAGVSMAAVSSGYGFDVEPYDGEVYPTTDVPAIIVTKATQGWLPTPGVGAPGNGIVAQSTTYIGNGAKNAFSFTVKNLTGTTLFSASDTLAGKGTCNKYILLVTCIERTFLSTVNVPMPECDVSFNVEGKHYAWWDGLAVTAVQPGSNGVTLRIEYRKRGEVFQYDYMPAPAERACPPPRASLSLQSFGVVGGWLYGSGTLIDSTVNNSAVLVSMDGGGSTSEIDNPFLSYKWYVNGSVVASGSPYASRSFPVGTSTVALVVTDAKGRSASQSATVTIYNVPDCTYRQQLVAQADSSAKNVALGDVSSCLSGGGGTGSGSGGSGGGGVCYEVWLIWRDANGATIAEEYLGDVCYGEYET
jgi:hypothetical protein